MPASSNSLWKNAIKELNQLVSVPYAGPRNATCLAIGWTEPPTSQLTYGSRSRSSKRSMAAALPRLHEFAAGWKPRVERTATLAAPSESSFPKRAREFGHLRHAEIHGATTSPVGCLSCLIWCANGMSTRSMIPARPTGQKPRRSDPQATASGVTTSWLTFSKLARNHPPARRINVRRTGCWHRLGIE